MIKRRTDWFPGDVKPVREGWYERAYRGYGIAPVQMCYWTGVRWSAGQGEAYDIPVFSSMYQNLPWRGLMK